MVDLEEETSLHSTDACEDHFQLSVLIMKECGYVIIIQLIVSSASDPWSSESSGSFVTLQLIPGQSVLDWGEPLEPGPDSEEFLRPPVHPTPAEKKVSLGLSLYFKI